MSDLPEHLSRIAAVVNLPHLNRQHVVIVGVGWVGSEIAQWLAKSGVGRLTLIDDKPFREHNIVRHALTGDYFGQNKATALADQLAKAIPTLSVSAVPHKIDNSLSDREVDELIMTGDVVVVATDNREAQRRVARQALRLRRRAVLPGLYEGGGGEVFVQLYDDRACFMCWDGFRDADAELREMAGLGVDGLFVIQLSVELCLGLLDRNIVYAQRFRGERVPSPVQLFQLRIQHGFALIQVGCEKQLDCPSCGTGMPRHTDEPMQTIGSVSIRRLEATVQGTARWGAVVFAAGFLLSLVVAFAAAHSFVVYDRASYVYGRALGFLTETLVLTGLCAAAASVVAEYLAQGELPTREGYISALVRRPGYRQTIIVAATVPALFLYLTHDFGPLTPLPSWWLVSPISVCIAHISYLTGDRFRIEPTNGTTYWIGGAAVSMFLIVAAIGGLPDTSADPRPASPVISLAEEERHAEEREKAQEEQEEGRLEEEAAEQEAPEFFGSCSPITMANAAAAFHCRDGKVAITTAFFARKSEANQELFERADEVGAVRTESGCPAHAPILQPFYWEEGGTHEDFLLCFIEGGRFHYVWTNTPEYEFRYSEATFPTLSARAAHRWWDSGDEEVLSQLPIERYPGRYKPCEAVYPVSGAVEAVQCSPSEVDINLQFFSDWRSANAHFQEKVRAVGISQRGRCAEVMPALEWFSYIDQRYDWNSGRLLCFVSGGQIIYSWIKPSLRLYGEAVFETADSQAAETWWRH